MAKRILIVAGVIVVGLVLVEVIALIQLKNSVSKYAEYWKSYPDNGDFTYVVLGDSAAQGIGAGKPELGYVGLLATRIEEKTGRSVRIVNLSVSGAKINDVRNNQVPQLAQYKPDLVTLEIGGNDIVSGLSTDKFAAHYDELLTLLPQDVFVANLPYFGGRIRKNTEAVAANNQIEALADKYGVRIVDLQTETRRRDSLLNYSSDIFHPSNRGYKIWTDAFWQSIEPTL